MKKRILASILCILMTCILVTPVYADTEAVIDAEENYNYSEGEVLITYKDEVIDEDDMDSSVLSSQDEIADADRESGAVTLATLDEGVSVDEAIEELKKEDGVESVQKNYTYQLQEETSGEEDSSGNFTSLQYYMDQSEIKEAWNLAGTDSKRITVAVLDTGINYVESHRHEDLKDVSDGGNILYDYGYNAVEGKRMSEPSWYVGRNKAGENVYRDSSGYRDYIGHGTEVASVISAQTEDDIGIDGVSNNAQILPINVFGIPKYYSDTYIGDGFYSYTSDATSASIIKAYKYVMEHADELNIKVINMSLAGKGMKDKALEKAINAAYNQGILTVASAGNAGDGDLEYPASFDKVLSVASVSRYQNHSGFSSHNSKVDVCAPGEGMIVAAAGRYYHKKTSQVDAYIQTLKNNVYDICDGTSYSAPLTAGVAALLYAMDDSMTAKKATELIEYTATDLGNPGKGSYYGYGQINALHAVMAAKSGGTISNHFTGQSTVSDDSGVTYTCQADSCSEFSYKIPYINLKNASATLSTAVYTYNGKAKKPSISVALGDDVIAGTNVTYDTRILKITKIYHSSNLSVSYSSGRKKVGTYKVTIKGKGFLKGTITQTFVINPVSTKITSVKALSGGFTAKWSKKKTQITGYELQYSTDPDFQSPVTKIIKSYKQTGKTEKKLEKQMTYYVRIRTYKTAKGKKYYSAWSAAKQVETK